MSVSFSSSWGCVDIIKVRISNPQNLTFMEFLLPLLVFVLAVAGFVVAIPSFYIIATAVGLFVLCWGSFKKLVSGAYSLDYIAILAMVVALATGEFGAGSVISLMILVSESLEAYSSREAEAALKQFVERIPKTCAVKTASGIIEKDIHEVRDGEIIFIRSSEIVPLDGHLDSESALMNEANLTGEVEPQAYHKGQFVKSGLINLGESIILRVAGDFSNSTYQRIVTLVQEAKNHPARIVRLAEKYNYIFTAVTLVMAAAAYAILLEPSHLLAVLVIATPCPLLIAAPVSFLGGLNKASKKNIVVKKPAALETISKINTIFFDKTGTLTIGEPRLSEIHSLANGFSEKKILEIAAALEIHSLHPLAKATVREKARRQLADLFAEDVHEDIGAGIAGTVKGKKFLLKKSAAPSDGGIAVDLFVERRRIGQLIFEDQIKDGTANLLRELEERYDVAILTGDTAANAEGIFGDLGVAIHAGSLPEDKYATIKDTQTKGGKVMMVGDGLNDAPALALADVGVVFSGNENSASIEAASVAILSSDVNRVRDMLDIAVRSTHIAEESILWGMGLSIVGMFFAMLGFIPPVTGAILQEVIDVTVILNALRSAA